MLGSSYWNNWQEFIQMGGKAGYVWGSFFMVAALMLIETWLLQRRKKMLIARLRRQLRAEQSQES